MQSIFKRLKRTSRDNKIVLLVVDIETLPTTNKSIIDQIRSNISPPANYKKAESIAEWHKEYGEIEAQKAISKTALNGFYGNIACIGITSLNQNLEPDETHMAMDLHGFYSVINGFADARVIIVGFNIMRFDLPFMFRNSLRDGIAVPPALLDENNIIDLMQLLASEYKDYISLAEACKVAGIMIDDSFTGEDVAKAWESGDKDAVIRHCKDDILCTAALFSKMVRFGLAENPFTI